VNTDYLVAGVFSARRGNSAVHATTHRRYNSHPASLEEVTELGLMFLQSGG
jgi:hypothetical protein